MTGKELVQWSAHDRLHEEELFRPSLYNPTRHHALD